MACLLVSNIYAHTTDLVNILYIYCKNKDNYVMGLGSFGLEQPMVVWCEM